MSDIENHIHRINSTDLKQLEFDEKQIEMTNHYQSCFGGKTDKRLIQILTQMSISLSILIFCFYQLANSNDTSTYIGLVGSISGFWLSSAIRNNN